MLFRWFRSHLHARARLWQEVDALVAAHGQSSWSVARGTASRETDPGRAERAWQIVHLLERRLKIDWQPDTATRWLEPGPRKTVPAPVRGSGKARLAGPLVNLPERDRREGNL